MTNYTDLPSVSLVQHEINQHVFPKEIPVINSLIASSSEINEYLTRMIIDLIKQHGFHNYDPQCLVLLQSCSIDFYNDLLIRFKQHFESLGTPITFQDAFERTLDDIMSINLQDLQQYMKKNTNLM